MNRINVGWAFGPLMHVAGFDYHHPSAEDAWRRIFAFFDEYLRDSATADERTEQEVPAEQTH
jgi:carboxymethylenebutenolidase